MNRRHFLATTGALVISTMTPGSLQAQSKMVITYPASLPWLRGHDWYAVGLADEPLAKQQFFLNADAAERHLSGVIKNEAERIVIP